MRKREVTLLDGVRVGADLVRTATVREGILGDTLRAASAGHSAARLDLAISMARVERLGDLAAPAEGVLALMTQRDWLLIERALMEIDAEGLRELREAGLLDGSDGGRAEPGAAPPGSA